MNWGIAAMNGSLSVQVGGRLVLSVDELSGDPKCIDPPFA
jgi:hypothetical protein